MNGMLRLPNEIRFGQGVRAGLPAIVTGFGARVFVVADPFLATTPNFAAFVEGVRVMGSEVLVHTDIPAELPVAAVEASAAAAAAFTPDVVVGYGGGSALDAAKLIAVLLAYGGPLSTYFGESAVPGPVVPLVAVPTTAGTGSEVTPVAVVSDPTRELKVGVSSPHIIPRVAVVDPDLTFGAPDSVSMFAGVDAFVHAVESFTAASLNVDPAAPPPVFIGRNALTESVSLQAASLIFPALPRVHAAPHDRAARVAMSHGSLLAGIAFGSTGTHLSHAIQYPIGAMTKSPHGLGTGALLPYVLQALRPAIDERLVVLGDSIGISMGSESSTRAQAVVDSIAHMCAEIGLPVALSDLGLTNEDTARIVDLTLQVGRLVAISPVPSNPDLLTRIVEAAIAGDRSLLSESE